MMRIGDGALQQTALKVAPCRTGRTTRDMQGLRGQILLMKRKGGEGERGE